MPTEAPNTLRSRAKFNIVDIISQGPIKGLFNGAKSIYLDETPVQNEDGTYNFPNFDVSRDLQELPVTVPTGSTTPIYPGLFPASENEVSVATKVTKNSPEGSGSGDGSVTRTITDASLDALRITMRVPALTNTNTTTGDITGGTIRFNIYVKPNGGVFAPISAGSQWEGLPAYNSETDDGATGIEVTATYPGGVNSTAITGTFQYRKKTGGVWGDWITFGTATIPAKTPSSDKRGYYNDYMGAQTFTRSVTNLTPGIYQAQIVSNKGITGTSARQFVENALEIQGKTVSAYDASYLVNLPDGGAPWDVKVVRISDDNIAANIQDDLYWFSYTEIIDNRFSWPNINGIRLSVDAESFGGNVPNRSYDVMGLMVQVPSNYDPYERTYTGVWNGTFKTDWTDNPAWIFYDLLTNKRYGLGDNIDASQIDKYALYQIAQYCDELVDAPNGEQEPRYTCSCVINSQSEAYELLTAIASAFRGMIYHSGGMITPVADMPSDPVLNVGPANVIDGIFTYQGASRKARHTVARVSWNNPDDGYKLNVELYEDTEAIRKYGYRPIDINAFGCTSRGLARRWGKWAIVSDNDAPDTVTYKAGFDHFNLRPGDVINIADPNYSGEQLFGLIVSVTDNISPATHTIKLDRAVARVAGDTSELQLTLADGSILALDVAVLANTTSDEITVDSAELTTIPLAGASWLLKKGTVEPRQWRVISISEDEPHIYQVTAMLYDPNKYDSIETGLNFAEADFTAFPSGPLAAPTGLAISEFLKQSGSAILECATFSWVRPADARAELFEMQYQEDGKDWQATTPNLTGVTSVDIINIVPGTYNFRVRAQDSSGIFRSEWATLSSQTLLGKQKKPENVAGFTATVEKFGILLKWTPVSDIDIDYYEIRSGASWAAGTVIGKPKAAEFKYEENVTGAYTFWIAAKDTSGNYSATPASASATISAQGTPTLSTVAVNGGIQLTIGGTVSRGFKNYEIQRKEYPSGAEVTINNNVLTRIFTDSDIATLGYVKSWQYRVRAVDQNGSASAYTAWSAQLTPKQIENNDITANQIIAKDFRTACNAGNGTVSGVLFNANGIQAWNGAINTFCINAATGDVCMTGTITATAGLIGGFTVDPLEGLHAGCTTTRVQMKPGAGFWAGATAQVDAPFSVTQAGGLKATSGAIAGWCITADQIVRCCINGVSGRIMDINSCCNSIYIYQGNAANGVFLGQTYTTGWTGRHGIAINNLAASIFEVSYDTSNNICAHIAGWNFNSTQIYSTGCGLILCNTGAIQTGLFQTGNQGWKIDSVGNAEFNNICARGAIRTAVFIKDQISVVGGCTMIRPASILSADDVYSASSNIYYVDDNTQFAVNDLIRIKSDAGDFWGKVTASATGCITVGYCNGNTSGNITKGQAIVNYGSCLGCGGIMLNGQCPYIDLYTHAGLPWCALESRVRIGNLAGWGSFDTLTPTYGIAAGCPTGQYMTYDSVSGVLNIKGSIIVGSSGIANFSDANIDNIADGVTYKRTTQNEKTGAGRAYSGLDSSNRLITAVIPGTAVTPSTAGLFIGSTNMGYHNGSVWKTYMDNAGNFYLGGSAAGCGLAWNAVTNCLTVCGCVSATAGCIAGWTITDACGIYSGLAGTRVQMLAGTGIWAGADAFASAPFSISTAGALKTCSGTIGGWNITSDRLMKCGATSAQYVLIGGSGCPTIHIAGCSSTGATYHTFGGCLFNGAFLNDRWGMVLRVGGNNLFQVHSCIDGTTCFCAQIAGWNFNASCLYSNNILINNNGSIYSNNYAAGSAGWCINGAGAAEFSNVTVRGTVCGSAGCFGCFSIVSGALHATSGATFSNMMLCSATTCAFWTPTALSFEDPAGGYPKSAYLAADRTSHSRTGPSFCHYASLNAFGCLRLYTTTLLNVATNTCLLFDASTDGATAATASMLICTYGGTSCYALCTNGRISVSGTVYPSDRNLKCAFEDYNVLDKLRRMPIPRWKFKGDNTLWHVGPMAQDFHDIFNFGYECTKIPNLDGLALRAAQELDIFVQKHEEKIDKHDKCIADLKSKLQKLECEMAALREMIN